MGNAGRGKFAQLAEIVMDSSADVEQKGTEDTEEDGSSEGETEKERAKIGKLRLRKSDCESLKGEAPSGLTPWTVRPRSPPLNVLPVFQ